MFKNAIIYRATFAADHINNPDLPEFTPCGPTQEKSSGWAPVRGQEHGALIEIVAGQTILKFVTETKTVPADVITRKAHEQAQEYEYETGYEPGKKMRAEIKEEVKFTLLPHAFAKRTATFVWLSPEGFVTIDTASQGKADDAITALVSAFEGLTVKPIHTSQSPTSSMAQWLVEQESPSGFTVDRECELKAVDDSKAVVKYGHHPLDIDEVKVHVMHGKLPTKLALTFGDRVSFVLTDNLLLKKLTFLDATAVLFDKEDAFDADVTLLAGEITPLISGLLEALGGEVLA